jgi:predicted PurR-regulated permease PerM
MQRTLKEYWPLDKKGTHIFLVVSALVVIFVFIIFLKTVFTPFFIALLLAYILNPIVNFGEKFSVPRWISTFAIFICFSLMILFFITVIVPSFISEFKILTEQNDILKSAPSRVIKSVRDVFQSHLDTKTFNHINNTVNDTFNALQTSGTFLKDTSLTMSKSLFNGILLLPAQILNFLLIPFYLFFLLKSLNRQWLFIEEKLIPYDQKELIMRICNQIHISLSAFFRGRLIISLFLGTITWVGFIFLDVPFPFLFGFAIGFATFIPLLGLVFLAPALFFYWMSGATIGDLMILTAFYTAIQGLELFVLTPIILGHEVELHPLILVLALVICGSLFGGIGVLLAVPIASTAKILFYEFIFPSFIELSKKETHSPNP